MDDPLAQLAAELDQVVVVVAHPFVGAARAALVEEGDVAYIHRRADCRMVDCADQAEVDHYWEALTAGGGQPGPCGWLKDRFGASWQVIPRRLNELVGGPDAAAAERAMTAMLEMSKIDVAELERAYAGG